LVFVTNKQKEDFKLGFVKIIDKIKRECYAKFTARLSIQCLLFGDQYGCSADDNKARQEHLKRNVSRHPGVSAIINSTIVRLSQSFAVFRQCNKETLTKLIFL